VAKKQLKILIVRKLLSFSGLRSVSGLQDSQCLSHRGYAEQMQTVSSEVVKNYGKPQKILTSLILWVQIR
jgi:hypothetical protein